MPGLTFDFPADQRNGLRLATGEGPAFPGEEFAARNARAVLAMERDGVDTLVASDPSTVCYFTGFVSMVLGGASSLVVLHADGEIDLIVSSWDVERAALTSSVERVCVYRDGAWAVDLVLPRQGAKTIALDVSSGALPVRAWQRLHARSAHEFVDAEPILRATRLLKTPLEIAALRRAAAMTDAGLDAMAKGVSAAGARECDVAGAGAAAMYAAGSAPFAIQPVVASGPRAAVAGSDATTRSIADGEEVFVEAGGIAGQYCAPAMRTLVRGQPSSRTRALAECAAAAVDGAARHLEPGVPARHAAEAACAVVSQAVDDWHGVAGCSVGIAFPPSWIEQVGFWLGTDSVGTVAQGMVFHVSVSLRDPGRHCGAFGQTILVGDGGSEVLTGAASPIVQCEP